MESNGRSRLRASRFPVPPGSGPSGVSVPTSAVATARTVPSPPSGQTTAAPSSTACRAWPVPGSAMVVSSQIGSPQPWARQVVVTRARTASRSVNFVGLTMIPARFSGGASSSQTLGPELVAVRAATPSGDPGGLQNRVTPRDDDRDDDREDDDRDDDPERRAVEHRPTLAGAGCAPSGQ